MHRFERDIGLAFLKLFDLCAMFLCFALGEYFTYMKPHHHPLSLTAFLRVRITVYNIITFIIFILIWHGVFHFFMIYTLKRSSYTFKYFMSILKSVTVAFIIIYVFGTSLHISLITPSFIVFMWALSLLIIAGSRILLRFAIKAVGMHSRHVTHLLIAGTNPRAISSAKSIESKPALGYIIDGFVENGWDGNSEFRQSQYSIVTDFTHFAEFIRNNIVDEVMIFLPFKSQYQEISEIVATCEEQGIVTRLPTDFFDLKVAKCTPETMRGEAATLAIASGNMRNHWNLLIKRLIDVSFSLVALLLCSPIMLITAVLIKLTSSGPVFFTQYRLGLNKRLFTLYKFRTMVADADARLHDLEDRNEVSGAAFKMKNDPRITGIGTYLRKMSIDELPQFVNVLRGDMSLVGPRPLPVRDFNNFDKDWHRRRFTVRPGITCLWQIKGRNAITFDQWMALDLRYIDHWSLSLDLLILAKTIPAVLKGVGAM